MPRRKTPAIFALEGEWSPRLTDRRSVGPLLDTLERIGQLDFIHRRVSTVDAMQDYVQRWSQQQYAHYALGYFAFHGSPGFVHIGRKRLSLAELADLLPGALRGRIIHFSSCGTIDVPQADLEVFCRVTGARAVTGYTESVDWLESAAFDLLLFEALAYYRRADAIERWLTSAYPDLVRRLGFRMHYNRRG
ncbi:MAG: hypothetical protein O2894_12915 [Planctomycetota bacterium]|nr:hypothetical protein [Planctomycetota bacterium]